MNYRHLLEELTSGRVHRRLPPPPPAEGDRVTGERPPSSTTPERSSGPTDANTTRQSGVNRRSASGAATLELASEDDQCLEMLKIELQRLSDALGTEVPQSTEDFQSRYDL